MKTHVINKYKSPRHVVNAPGSIYIGRGGMWANPYKIGDPSPIDHSPMSREDVLDIFKYHLKKRKKPWAINIRKNIRQLKNKRLVCFCVPQRCHGHILISLLNYVLRKDLKRKKAS